ncbi:transposon Tf2-1 polyprotein isoform X1, partial [Tanacetum coccineum]
PLKIPGQIWDFAMDFITHLPMVSGKTVIFVVVDRLSKHAHFSALGTHFTAPQVAEIFIKDIVRLHGIPSSIVSDRDRVFMTPFEAVYERSPPSLLDYVSGSSSVASVEHLLQQPTFCHIVETQRELATSS